MGKVLFYKYELLRLIGVGGTGKVYLAKDLHLDRLVAVKESTEEFLSVEMTLLKELEHPGLPQIYDCIRQEGITFLVMEYIEGMTLRQYLDKRGRVPEGQAIRWAVDLCRILGYLHERHPAVVYRDLKPENIMIRQDGEIKLIDLGGALKCAFGREREELCAGTMGYSPPEQWKETQGRVTFDVYGLGAVLHEMLTGANPTHPPYVRHPIGEYGGGYRGALEGIIKKCTAENFRDRYQSMEQLENALLHYKAKGLWPRIVQAIRVLAVVLSGGYGGVCLFLSLARGIPENLFPFPFLTKPLVFLFLSFFLYLIFFKSKNRQRFLRRQERNIWLTEKKFRGLYSVMFFLLGGICSMTFFGLAPMTTYAGGDSEKLWVEMRDDLGRKMLLKDDAVYITDDKVRFELPADRLPGEELSMQIVAVGEEGDVYSSRIFRILAEK